VLKSTHVEVHVLIINTFLKTSSNRLELQPVWGECGQLANRFLWPPPDLRPYGSWLSACRKNTESNRP